jgi:predicted nucleic acid-binding protein
VKKAVFVDTDVVLDLLARREPFYFPAARLFSMAERGTLIASVSSLSFANLHYILRKETSGRRAIEILKLLQEVVTVLPVDGKTVSAALNAGFTDFEDALQYHSALAAKVPVLVTRNVKHYRKPAIRVCTAEEYLAFPGGES